MLDTTSSAFATWAYFAGKRVLRVFLDRESALTGYSSICLTRSYKSAARFDPRKVLNDKELEK